MATIYGSGCGTLAVYSGSVVISTLALAPLVGLIRHTTRYQSEAPYLAGALVAAFTVISSFLGHKHFSFGKRPVEIDSMRRTDSA